MYLVEQLNVIHIPGETAEYYLSIWSNSWILFIYLASGGTAEYYLSIWWYSWILFIYLVEQLNIIYVPGGTAEYYLFI